LRVFGARRFHADRVCGLGLIRLGGAIDWPALTDLPVGARIVIIDRLERFDFDGRTRWSRCSALGFNGDRGLLSFGWRWRREEAIDSQLVCGTGYE
jgi:hypothetical protein